MRVFVFFLLMFRSISERDNVVDESSFEFEFRNKQKFVVLDSGGVFLSRRFFNVFLNTVLLPRVTRLLFTAKLVVSMVFFEAVCRFNSICYIKKSYLAVFSLFTLFLYGMTTATLRHSNYASG